MFTISDRDEYAEGWLGFSVQIGRNAGLRRSALYALLGSKVSVYYIKLSNHIIIAVNYREPSNLPLSVI